MVYIVASSPILMSISQAACFSVFSWVPGFRIYKQWLVLLEVKCHWPSVCMRENVIVVSRFVCLSVSSGSSLHYKDRNGHEHED